jgi:hypothetical protein
VEVALPATTPVDANPTEPLWRVPAVLDPDRCAKLMSKQDVADGILDRVEALLDGR